MFLFPSVAPRQILFQMRAHFDYLAGLLWWELDVLSRGIKKKEQAAERLCKTKLMKMNKIVLFQNQTLWGDWIDAPFSAVAVTRVKA